LESQKIPICRKSGENEKVLATTMQEVFSAYIIPTLVSLKIISTWLHQLILVMVTAVLLHQWRASLQSVSVFTVRLKVMRF